MNRLIEEVKEWNTPIVSAYLLWRFSSGFCEKHPHGEAPVVILHFIAAAILTSDQLSNVISRRRPNLESFVRSFNEDKKSDVLACLSQRIISKRSYTLASIDIAVSSGFLAWDSNCATLHPRSVLTNDKRKKGRKLGTTIIDRGNKAEILGEWFANHDIPSITSYLGVIL